MNELVRQQFGANAERYVRSAVHARGQSLERMIALAKPQPHWLALDVASGGGHSALAIARRTRRVVALDITGPMLKAARAFAREQGVDHISWMQGDGQFLPFATAIFDLVTCRVALHHFSDPPAAIRAWARALKPGGRLVLVDNVGPDDRAANAYVNAFEALRDPSHGWMHPLATLVDFVKQAGLRVTHVERLIKPMDFAAWMDRMNVDAETREHLEEMLRSSRGPAREFLNPQGRPPFMTFDLHEGVVAAEA
ncbi:MAG: methyltransferase domain-containing protein [Chloroflexi bacterium]|nr:methyltransferase domain-containing protein [Chloroflexota bacterium]